MEGGGCRRCVSDGLGLQGSDAVCRATSTSNSNHMKVVIY